LVFILFISKDRSFIGDKRERERENEGYY